MATGTYLQRWLPLIAMFLLASCQQEASPNKPAQSLATAATETPAIANKTESAHNPRVLAFLQQRYGQAARLDDGWAQQWLDPEMELQRAVHRRLCTDQSINLGGKRYRMLAICTTVAEAAHSEPGRNDLIVLSEADDGALTVVSELLNDPEGSSGVPADVSTLQVGAQAWTYVLDSGWNGMGMVIRSQSLMLFDGGASITDAGWVRSHIDNKLDERCDDNGDHCVAGTLDLDFKLSADASQPQLALWPLHVRESGNGCDGLVTRDHRFLFDTAQRHYPFPEALQLESCN